MIDASGRSAKAASLIRRAAKLLDGLGDDEVLAILHTRPLTSMQALRYKPGGLICGL